MNKNRFRNKEKNPNSFWIQACIVRYGVPLKIKRLKSVGVPLSGVVLLTSLKLIKIPLHTMLELNCYMECESLIILEIYVDFGFVFAVNLLPSIYS